MEDPFAGMGSADPAQQELPPAADLVAEYVRLRDAKNAAEDAIKAWTEENFARRMRVIETQLMAFLNDGKIDSIKTDGGTAFKRTETSITVADQAAFSRYVIGGEHWKLIDFRASKSGVKEFLEEHKELPPGVNHTSTTVISVRKPS